MNVRPRVPLRVYRGMNISRLLFTVLSVPALGAQLSLPDTPAGRRFSELSNAFNRADREALRAFHERYQPQRLKDLDGQLAFREQTGGFELLKVEESTPARIAVVMKEKDFDQYAHAEMEVEEAEPHKVLKYSIRAITRPAEFPGPTRLPDPELAGALRELLEKRAAQDKFAGAVLVARDGKTIFEGAYGLADRAKKVPNKLDSQFRLGSMNKMFTAVAVAQLAQQGRIRLEDPIGKYLPDYKNRDVATKVTVHHLLTHTGGTGDIFVPQFTEKRLSLRDLKDYVALYGERAPKFEPGSRWEYSNYGFLLLGVLVEAVSKKSYYDYVQEHIFKPAGMTATDSLPEETVVGKRTVGYTKMGGGELRPNNDTLPYRGTSAGGGYSTVGDLVRFARALLQHKLLNAEYTRLVTTGKVDAGPGRYAYGFSDINESGVRRFGHGGGAPGMNGDLQIFPDSGVVVAVLSNLDPPAASKIASFVGARLVVK